MANEIKNWRPKTWSEFIGKENRRTIERHQRRAIAHQPPSELIIAPYGAAKTALARHIKKSHCCSRVTSDGDPCHTCESCMRQGPDYNGDGLNYQQYEFDCLRLVTKAKLLPIIEDIEVADKAAVFFDQFEGLSKKAFGALLTFLNDFRGIFIAAIADDDFRELREIGIFPPPLFERLRKVYLQIPEAEEMVAFFQSKCPEWDVAADEELLRLMVTATQRSFRTCLHILQAAHDDTLPVLTRDTIEEFLTLDDNDEMPEENDDYT